MTFTLAAQPDFFLEDVWIGIGRAGKRVRERGCRAEGLQFLRRINDANLEEFWACSIVKCVEVD